MEGSRAQSFTINNEKLRTIRRGATERLADAVIDISSGLTLTPGMVTREGKAVGTFGNHFTRE